MDYYRRLLDDADALGDPQAAPGWPQTMATTATLDLSLAHQLVAGSPLPLASIRGIGETLVRSSADGTLQPVAVYVPPAYVAGRVTPVIVFLHGRPQSESSLIAPQFLHDLADRSGTILIAPYGRGYYNFRGGESDVYDALDAATHAFTIDARKEYLAGYSMGGFSVFSVAPVRPRQWAAVMSIAGSLLGSRARAVVTRMAGTPFYVLTGSLDDSIPTQYPTSTAQFLHNNGFAVGFYSDPKATHRLYTMQDILAQAWDDMEHGIVREPPSALTAAIPLMSAPPPAMKI